MKWIMGGEGIMIFGFSFPILLMFVSGIFYLIVAIMIWKPFRQEKNELINALFAFLVYQSISMIFMGFEMLTHNIWYSNISALAILLGSAYMLKFPFSMLSKKTRNIIFLINIILALSVFAWFMTTIGRQEMLMHLVLWYDVIANGIIVGGSIILFSFKTIEKMKKKKTLAGGAGVVSCCVVSNVAMISGAFFISAIFQFLAPLLIFTSIRSMRSNSSNPLNQSNSTNNNVNI